MTLREFIEVCETLGIDMDSNITIKNIGREFEPIEIPTKDGRLQYTINYIEQFTDHVITFETMYTLTVDGVTDSLLTFRKCMKILEPFRIEAKEGKRNGHEHK